MIKKSIFKNAGVIILGIAVVGILGNYLYKKPKYAHGEVAPNFVNYLANGDSIQLSDFEGKMVLLDFWGSWCGPCREENPKLVKLYEKFNGKKFKDFEDFEIISVGIETRKQRWLNAIKKDGLYWENHVSDFQRLNSKTAKLYGVREIPTKYLISPEGYIIGVNTPFEELDKILSDELALN